MSKGSAPVSYEPTYRQIAPASNAETVELLAPGGEIQQVRAAQAGTLRALGYKDMTPEIRQQMADQAKYGGTLGELGAAALGGARGATFGASDVAIRGAENAGMLPEGSTEDVRKLQEINPMASLGGELASFAVPGLAAVKALGKVGTVAKGLGAAQAAVGEVGTVLGNAASKIVGEKLGGLAAPAVKLAAESAIFQAGHNISENALADKDLTVEAVMSNLGTAAVLGGGLGVALPLGLRAAKASASALAESSVGTWFLDGAEGSIRKFLDPERSTQIFTGAMKKELNADTGKKFQDAVSSLRKKGLYGTGEVEINAENAAFHQSSAGSFPDQEALMDRVTESTETLLAKRLEILRDVDTAIATPKFSVKGSDQWAQLGGNNAKAQKQFQRDFVEEVTAFSDKAKSEMSQQINKLQRTGVIDDAVGAKEMIAKYKNLMQRTGGSLEKMQELKEGVYATVKDANYQAAKAGAQAPPSMQLLKQIGRYVKENIDFGVERLKNETAYRGLANQLASVGEINQTLAELATIQKPLASRIAANSQNVNVLGLRFRDIGIGAIGGGVLGGPAGVALGFANKALQTDRGLLARAAMGEKLATLGWLTKATEAAEKGIAKSMSGFINGVNTDAVSQAVVRKLGTKGAGMVADMANQDHSVERRQQTQREWFDKTAAELQMVASDPQGFATKQGVQLASVAHSAPQVAEMIVGKQMQAYSYLLAAMPKNPTNPMNILNAPWHPADYEIQRFADVVKTVREPMSVLADLSAGTLSRAQTKALQTLYPSLYNTMLSEVQRTVSAPGVSVPYDKRLQLGMLFPGVESSLNGSFINAMASSNAPPNEKQGGGSYSASGASKSKIGSRHSTQTDTLNER